MNNNNTLKVGTDFSGIGAPEQALTNLGINYESVFACEIDKFARKSYKAIHPKPETFYNDITQRNHAEVEQLDLYIAGFPCQTFSLAGSRKGFDDVRGTLFFNVADFIRINQPKCFVLENVKGLLSHNNGATFQTIVSLLSDNGGTANGQVSIPYFEDGLGYHIYYSVLNSKNHGVPQNRERIFIVGFRDFRSFSFPKSEPLKIKLKDVLQDNPDYFKLIDGFNSWNNIKYVDNDFCGTITQHQSREGITNGFKIQYDKESNEVDDKYFLSDKTLSKLNIETEQGTMIKKSVKNEISTCIDASYYKGFGIRNGVCRQVVKVPSATSKGFEEATDGDSINYSVPNSKTRRGRVGKGVAQTLDTDSNMAVFNDKKIRRLTPLECWRLQSFPDEQLFKAQAVNSDTQLYKQAGNSITVRVIQKIISKIYETV